MSSLIASQSTLCLQTRQDAVAKEPGSRKVVYKSSILSGQPSLYKFHLSDSFIYRGTG